MSRFKEIMIIGDAHARGRAHGEQLRDEIATAIDFYRSAFALEDAIVMEQASYFRRVISDFNSDYATEIEGIAEAAGQDTLWLVALNARTEILALKNAKAATSRVANECTSLCFGDTALVGQTWDWGEPLEHLCAVAHLEREDGHRIRMLVEPGMLGKIGMNSAGVGVCLNILTLPGQRLDGLPIHVMLRAILDSISAAGAAATIDSAAAGKSSNVVVADKSGACFEREFAGAETFLPAPHGDTVHVHTNHYCGREINAPGDPEFYNSRTRMKRAQARIDAASDHSVESMQGILSDRSDNPYPIFRPYLPDEELVAVGTVATMVMDLKAGDFHIRRGADAHAPFVIYSV